MQTVREGGLTRAERVFPPLVPVEHGTNAVAAHPQASQPVILEKEVPTASPEHLMATSLSMQNLHLHGDLFVRYLRARRAVFIVSKGWKLPEVDGMEFDQYDTPMARWIVVHEGGEVLAGIRIAPTTSRCGLHSYMIRDAQLGLLDSLPLDPLFFPAPVAEHMWEATRLFVAESVPAHQRAEVQRILLLEMAATARKLSVTHVLGIVPAVFKRWMLRIGMAAVAVGPKFMLDGDQSQAAMMHVADAPDPFAIPSIPT